MNELSCFIGYDSKEDIAYRVCKHSLLKRSSKDVKVYSLKLQELVARKFYSRSIDPLASTEFTYSRFLVPTLNNFKGWAVFCDCDFVWRIPSYELEQYCDDSKAVVCVQHDYTPEDGSIKMDGQIQLRYPRKNWSSMVLWNCGHPKNKVLTPELLNLSLIHI